MIGNISALQQLILQSRLYHKNNFSALKAYYEKALGKAFLTLIIRFSFLEK